MKKKCGELRLIIDCRRANQLFLDLPGVDLVTGDGLSMIEIDTGDAPLLFKDLCISFGEGDVSDLFHRLKWARDVRRRKRRVFPSISVGRVLPLRRSVCVMLWFSRVAWLPNLASPVQPPNGFLLGRLFSAARQ